MFGIFPHPQQIVEGNADEVCNGVGLGFVVLGLAGVAQDVFDQGDRDGELGHGRGVPMAVVAQLVLYACVVLFVCARAVDGVGVVSQLEGLADGAKRVLNRANSDLMASSCPSFAYMSGKTREEVNSLASGELGEKRVHVKVVAPVLPMRPISQADLGSLIHDPMFCGSLRSSKNTRKVSLLCRRAASHECPCGRGKRELKWSSKVRSSQL